MLLRVRRILMNEESNRSADSASKVYVTTKKQAHELMCVILQTTGAAQLPIQFASSPPPNEFSPKMNLGNLTQLRCLEQTENEANGLFQTPKPLRIVRA